MNSLGKLLTIPRFASTRCKLAIAAGVGVMLLAPGASAQDLSSYAILAGSEITNTGTTNISGNIGLSPGTSFTGQGPGADQIVQINGTINIANAAAVQAKNDLTTAFNVLMGRPSTALVGDLGGQTLTAGVYSFASSAQLTGPLPLTLSGGPDDIFIIKVGSSLTTGPGSMVLLDGGAQARNVFFVVGESVTLDTNTAFVGQILAGTSITLNTNATILCGAALAQVGAVTLDTNTINICTFTTTPEEIAELLGDDITDTGGSIIGAIADFVAGGGDLPLSFQLLALLSPTELATALEQLSGEIGTQVAPAGMQSMDSFLDLLRGGHRGTRALLTDRDLPQPGGTVSVMGYAPDRQTVGGGAFDSFYAPTHTPRDGQWTAWITSYGVQSWVAGDGAGLHDRTAVSYGAAIGFESQVDTATMLGFALSGGGTSFEVADDLGSGESAMLQAAVYARSEFDQAYLTGALAAGVHQVALDRVLTFAGTDHFTADFTAANFAGEIEAGYHIGWLTPFAALRGQVFSTPGYSETTVSGSSIFALDYEANTVLSLRTEIGARAEWSTEMSDSGTLTLHASAAWAHEVRSGDEVVASFQSLPGATFTVSGATPAADSLLASTGADLELGSGLTLSGTVGGRFTENALDYSAMGGLSYSW